MVLQVSNGAKKKFEPFTLLDLAQLRLRLCNRHPFSRIQPGFLNPQACLSSLISRVSLSQFFPPLSHTLIPPFIPFFSGFAIMRGGLPQVGRSLSALFS